MAGGIRHTHAADTRTGGGLHQQLQLRLERHDPYFRHFDENRDARVRTVEPGTCHSRYGLRDPIGRGRATK